MPWRSGVGGNTGTDVTSTKIDGKKKYAVEIRDQARFVAFLR